jgi:solute:Na+ symporter, SSS family
LGLSVWAVLLFTPLGEEFPAQLAGLVASLFGMVVGSLAPQFIHNTHASHHKLSGT